MITRLASLVSGLVFGTAPQQRRLLQRTVLASIVGGLLLVLHLAELRSGVMTSVELWDLTVFCVSGTGMFYGLIRSGLNIRFGRKSSLTLAMQVFAMATMIWTYAVGGPDRGAVTALMVLILMFGVFAFRPRVMAGLALLTLASLGLVMLAQYHANPHTYPLDVSAFHLVYAALALLPVCFLSNPDQALAERAVQREAGA